MMKTRHRFSHTIAYLCLFWIAGFASLPSKDSLGIPPQDESYYKSSLIKCKDGSKSFTKEQLNDEFCDCADGTDEPGTSACPEGKFYCRNRGHTPLTIFSSRVNDGICDCCDGSDEYDGNVNCPNSCWEAGKMAREKLKKKIATYEDGVIIRKQEVEKAKQAFAKDEAELSKLKSEVKILKGLVQKLKEHKELIEKAEKEHGKKEEENRLVESEMKASQQAKPSDEPSRDNAEGAHEEWSKSLNEEALEASHDSIVEAENDHSAETEISANQAAGQHVAKDHDDTMVKAETSDDARSEKEYPSHQAKPHLTEDHDDDMLVAKTNDDTGSKEASPNHVVGQTEASEDTEGLSREELGRLVASRWAGENSAPRTNEVDNTAKEEEEKETLAQGIPGSAQEEDYNGYSSETDEDGQKYDEDDIEDGSSDDEYGGDHVEPNGSYDPDEDDITDSSDFTASSGPSWLNKIQQTVQRTLQAFNFFKTPVDVSEAAHVRKEYDDSRSKLSKIQSRISSLNEKLKHDFGKEKEFYSFYDRCFENKQNKYVYKLCPFKQVSQVEGHSTTQLGRWEQFEESYRVMQFSHGDKCWNGPDRSMKVRLRCGLKNELTDVDEPSRCEYVALLSTPVVCLEEKLKELQQKLELTNSGQTLNHDEL